MAFNAEQLNIIIAARTQTLQRELDGAERKIKRFEAQSKGSLGGFGNSFKMLGDVAKRAAPFMAGFISASALTDAMQYAQEIQNLARVSGTGVERFQEMAFASKGFGISQEKLADILKDTNDKLGDFFQTGAGPMADFFENIAPKVGITADSFRKLSGPDALQLYVDSLQKAGVSQSEMTFYMEALASDSALLTPLLANNGAEMERLGVKARSLGIVLDEDLIRQTAQMNEVWAATMTTMSANFTRFAAYVVSGFDNIFGITLAGQLNKLRMGLNDIETEITGLESSMLTADSSGPIMTEDGLGVMSMESASERLSELKAQQVEYQTAIEETNGILRKQEEARAAIANTPSFGSATKGGGKKGKDDAKKAWDSLIASIDSTKKANIDFANAQKVVNDALQAGIITQQEADFALGVLANRMQIAKGEMIDLSSVAGVLENSLTDAFMSIIDGTQSTKDAFKSMARAVIAELYRVLVVQRLVGSIGTASKAGSGILGFIGNAFPALKAGASGGYVQAGNPMVVGEHGRELFVPPVNGRILNAAQAQNMSRGSSGGVTIVQNINISTGVQQTVRNEIRSLMPQIADSAKAAVLDAKRRGGSYGSAFA